ncbi:uncharacterized protein PHALS_08093 [Plasmopara halstedii]|uniref:Uncharacterized protein n=1 Tax=Plasmopara halstedii TaxID=4781 RepID=A0A0P1B888_PLAHL|nr:uncharacterized protein PHALS_08093 [Plasmopara halstedii]CEG50381.1 hypothetical protein PHALS_08093 [Plasmopara halstedii]|eukprot:XP_024586750.1 hypothetical protein PHALS_08093 [Plasmopara halstedii]
MSLPITLPTELCETSAAESAFLWVSRSVKGLLEKVWERTTVSKRLSKLDLVFAARRRIRSAVG